MATLVIPTRTDLTAYSQETVLNGETFTLSFQFNDREQTWYIDVITQGGDIVREGIKVVSNWVLMRLAVDASAPSGYISTVDSRVTPAPAGESDLGDSVLLTFEEA